MKQASDRALNAADSLESSAEDTITLFRLYVADQTIASEQAVANLSSICERHIAGRYEVETIDILQQPLRAMSEGVLITPTLLRLAPLPVRRIVGDLSDTRAVLYALGFRDKAPNEKN